MSEITRNESNFIGYEYKDITVKRKMESVYTDGYNNFGWALEGTSTSVQNVGSVTIKFKRDRKIRNKVELTRLQRQFDAAVAEIETLESSKVIGASVVAYVIGVIGTSFMAGSVFANQADIFAAFYNSSSPRFRRLDHPIFSLQQYQQEKTNKVAPLIDQKFDKIYEVCEKANALLGK